jgi:hypothetical protein
MFLSSEDKMRPQANQVQQVMVMPPSNVSAEESLLGSILIDPSVIEDVNKIGIGFSDFHIEKNGWIFAAMKGLMDCGKQIDFVTLCDELQRRDQLIEAGGEAYLSHLMAVVPTAMHATSYAGIIREDSAKRMLLELASKAAASAYRGVDASTTVDNVISLAQRIKSKVRSDDGKEPEQQVKIVPDLQESARVKCDIRGVGSILDMYLMHSLAIAPMTPVQFHESAALWLGSVAIARRLKAPLPHGDVYPNLFIAWIAPSTLWHKTTALNVARKIVYRAFPHLLAAADTTIEGLLSDWSGKEPENLADLSGENQEIWRASRDHSAQRGMVLDEMSGLLAGAGRDYNAGMIECLLRFFDCDERYTRSTRGQGLVVVKDAYMSFLGASTPIAMYPHMANERLWSNGFWPRFALLAPEDDHPEYLQSQDTQEPTDIVDALRVLYNRLPRPQYPDAPEVSSVVIESDAMSALQRYTKAVGYDLITEGLDSRLWAVYGRLPDHLVKVAMILASFDWSMEKRKSAAPTIAIEHIARAMEIVEGWRVSAHRTIEQVTMSDANRFLQRVLRNVISTGERGVTLRELYKSMKDRQPFEISNALDQLVQAEEIEAIDAGTSKIGGRPTKRYRRMR